MTSHYDGCYDSTDASFSTQNNGRPLSYSFPWKHDLILPGQQSLPCPVCPWEEEPSYLLAAHPTHSSSLAIKGRYISSSCLLYSDDLFSFSLSCQSVCWHLATFFPVALFSWFGYCFLQLLPVLPSFIRWRFVNQLKELASFQEAHIGEAVLAVTIELESNKKWGRVCTKEINIRKYQFTPVVSNSCITIENITYTAFMNLWN